MIREKYKLFAVSVVFLVLGGLVGGYTIFQFASLFKLDALYTGKVARTAIDVAMLDCLHQGNIEKVIRIMEMNLEFSAITLNVDTVDLA